MKIITKTDYLGKEKICCLSVSWYAPDCLADKYFIPMNDLAWKEKLCHSGANKLEVNGLLMSQSVLNGLELCSELYDLKTKSRKSVVRLNQS